MRIDLSDSDWGFISAVLAVRGEKGSERAAALADEIARQMKERKEDERPVPRPFPCDKVD